MSAATIRTAIYNILSAADVGRVHKYERWAPDWNKFIEFFRTPDNKINGWTVTRRQVQIRDRSGCEQEHAHIFVVRGYYGLKDSAESELLFDLQVDEVRSSLSADETLGGVCETTHPDWGAMTGAAGLQIDVIEPRMFGSVLCHFAEGRICPIEHVIR